MLDIEKIMLVIDCIEEHLTENLDLRTIAQTIESSRFYLHRSFAHAMGLTIHDYARRRQLTEAARQLMLSDTPILRIALLAGFESQQSFTKAFKAMYKHPPNVFRKNYAYYPLQLPFRPKGVFKALNDNREDSRRNVAFADESDIPAWMDLVRLVIDGYPFFNEDQYMKVLGKAIANRQALIVRKGEMALGIMLFSAAFGAIDFLGVHPLYRNKGIAQLLLNKVKSELPGGRKEISITTYREGDKADTGYRKAIKQLGFIESELLFEFGYPTQKFLLRI